MAFCAQCGSGVGQTDQYCPKCGHRQGDPSRPPQPSPADLWNNISVRNASLLCYIPWVGWLAAIAVLASNRFRGQDRVRFHAFQGLYLFVAYMLVEIVVSPMMRVGGWNWQMGPNIIPRLLTLILFGAWIFMLIKVNQDEDFRLPILGELADRSVAEQRF
ncbi:MAG: hypothetical protein ABI811_24370 [Acidobacteriota bacterium]